MSDDLFSTPSDLPKGGLKIADLEGSLVIVKPKDEEVTLMTSMGEGVARPAEILVVTGAKADKSWQEILLFGAGLKAQAGAAVRSGKPIVGVIGKGAASPGKSAPWIFADPTPAQVQMARDAYLAAMPVAPF